MLIFMAHQLGHKVTPATGESAGARRSIYRYAGMILATLVGAVGGLIGRAI